MPRKTRSFAFTGMIRCGECGFSVTGEEKTNRYGQQFVYYHCTKRRLDFRCGQPYVPLEEMEEQILEFLEEITLSKKFHDWALARIKRTSFEDEQARAAQKDSLVKAQAATKQELGNLTKLRIRELLTDEEYLKQRQELEQQQIGLAQNVESLNADTGGSNFRDCSFRSIAA